MKNTYFKVGLMSSNLLVIGFLICLSAVLSIKAQEFSPLSPAAITYGSQSSASFPAPAFQARIAVADFDADGDADILYQTGNIGYYQFEDLEIGIYIVTVKSKGHEFNQSSQVLTILQDEENFDFVGIPVLKAF